MPVGNPATAVAGQAGQMNAALWNTEVRDQFNQSLLQGGTTIPIGSLWTASSGTPAVGSTGIYVGRYLKVGRLVTVGFYAFVQGTGASFGGAGATWSFILPFGAVTGSSAYYGGGRGCPNGSVYYPLTPVLASSTAVVLAGPASGTATNLVSVGQPNLAGTAWIVGGFFGWSITYESAT